MLVFDEFLRNDDGIRVSDEDTFAFLNRVDDVFFGRVRDLVEQWFAFVPAAEQKGLRARLRSGREGESAAAFWELYLREMIRRSGWEFISEPELDGGKCPDFRVEAEGGRFYLEAVLLGKGDAEEKRDRRRDHILDELRKIDHPDFVLRVEIVRDGNAPAKLGPVRQRAVDWLSDFDYEVLRACQIEDPRLLPGLVADAGAWSFRFTAWPKPPNRRGQRLKTGGVGIDPLKRLPTDGGDRLFERLRGKAGRYGDLGLPFLLAACVPEVSVDLEDVVKALWGEPAFFGSDDGLRPGRLPNGVFSGRGHPRVSGVLLVQHFRPWLVDDVVPLLWTNPNATFPFVEAIPIVAPAELAEDGQIVVGTASVDPATFFGLPPAWPGPERPLRVRQVSG